MVTTHEEEDCTMKLTLMTRGGFATGIRRPPRVVDSSQLPESAARKLTQLVAAARAVPEDVEKGPGRARDAMTYTITIDDNGESTVVKQSDTMMTPQFAALLEWLEGSQEGK